MFTGYLQLSDIYSLPRVLLVRINTCSVFLFYSAAGPHTTIDGKEVVNFASANYLGLIGNEKVLVRQNSIV